jgi:hypothetical protein
MMTNGLGVMSDAEEATLLDAFAAEVRAAALTGAAEEVRRRASALQGTTAQVTAEAIACLLADMATEAAPITAAAPSAL